MAVIDCTPKRLAPGRMIHARCFRCTEVLCWRHVQGRFVASCCALVFDARPIETGDFVVHTADAIARNVIPFPPRRWYR